ncbi:PREDICTED: cell division control protein 48 homolog C [Tarenaya hassleriana]|uniref:cell division control protein 48 homolog C n=1 Tax=Tarenaya hassleriana TaxID=28532 RepID=UPI00053C9F3F|nr:PREDICTED: cell division control protein 48 homolog C [Tarenaya hassleriana]
MGKRFRGGGIGGGVNRRFLNVVIDSYGKEASAEDIVDDLRSKYRDFGRLSRQVLLLNVRQVLNSRNRRIKEDEEEDNSGDEGGVGARKKQRRVNEREEKLQRAEQSHLRRRNSDRLMSTSSSDSPSAESSSRSEADGAVSTSEDAIYSEKVTPQFDLISDTLRDSYAKLNSASKNPIASSSSPVEKNVEVETVSNKARTKMGIPNREGVGEKKEVKSSVSVSGATGNGDLEVKINEGPMFKDFGGIENVLGDLEMNVLYPMLHLDLVEALGVKPPGGILLHGPPGCGKTKLAHAIANELGFPFYRISATEVVSGVSGASEENIRELFSKAYRTAPSVVFIDEIDAIASKRENQQREMERRIVTQLMTCMDDSLRYLKANVKNSNEVGSDSRPRHVLVIGATNRPDALDSALRRPGRFDREIPLSAPDEKAREEILSVLTHGLRLEGSFDRKRIARATPGFVGADLAALVNQAGMIAMKRIANARKLELPNDSEDRNSWLRQPWSPEDREKLFIIMSDFEEAVVVVQASSTREGFSTIPNVKWEDVGGLDHLRQEFERYIIKRIKSPEAYERFGVDLETGFLLYGPPGCGKTLIAKAVANEAGANFIHIKGPELLNKYVGESELAVRELFRRARNCSPCVLFFDEVDALTTKRGKEGGWVVERLLNQLLIELDGAEQKRHNVFVIGATNRPDVMDPAVIRPGRFGRLLYVPLPSSEERVSILKAVTKNKPVDESVDLHAVANMEGCEYLSGADLAALVNEAAMRALDESESVLESTPCTIKMVHFEKALSKISPSVSERERQHYEELPKRYKNGTGRNIEPTTRESNPSFSYS